MGFARRASRGGSSGGHPFRYLRVMSPSTRRARDPAPPANSVEFLSSHLHPGDPAFAGRVALAERKGREWDEITYRDLDRRSKAVAEWLHARGVGAGDRVALFADAGGEWVVAFFGILRAGGVVVPLDPKLTVPELSAIAERAGASALVCSRRLLDVVDRALGPAGLPVLLLGAREADDHHAFARELAPPSGPGSPTCDVARSLGDLALLVFTAGTTGAPKGVMLSFANVAHVVTEGVRAHRPGPRDVWLSLLPPSHMLELSCGLLPALATGGCVSFTGTLMPHEIVEAMRARGVTRMVVVPLVLRLLKRHVEAQLLARARHLRWALPLARRLPSAALRRLLFTPVHRRLGGRLSAFYSGGAALSADVALFFDGLGIAVYEGYGLTETAPVISVNTPARNRLGSVGPALPGTEIRIARGPEGRGGEILVRTPALMLGYWGDETLTRSVIDDEGWFHTGDLGELDADGFLHLTGRSKDLIVLESGKKVQPEEIETVLEESPLFQEVCIVGSRPSGRASPGEQVCAVVVPAAGAVPPDRPRAQEAVEAEVRRLTSVLSAYKRPTVVVLRDGPLPRTVKRSVRRAEVRRLLEEVGVA